MLGFYRCSSFCISVIVKSNKKEYEQILDFPFYEVNGLIVFLRLIWLPSVVAHNFANKLLHVRHWMQKYHIKACVLCV